MKHYEDSSRCSIALTVETLAVSFSECSGSSFEDDKRGSLASNHRSGKSLFRRFVKENRNSVWKPEFVKSLSSVRFGGYLQDPPTLLLQGESTQLQHIRDAWTSRILKAPVRYHIDFVGDVTRIGARPLTRDRFVPLCDAVCVSIGNVTSRDDVATQEAILVELERSFTEVHSPSRELLHETLGKLIRNRKVFCTGPGYHLVTTKTYSGKTSDEELVNRDRLGQGCQTCLRNRKSGSFDEYRRDKGSSQRDEMSDFSSDSKLLSSPTSSKSPPPTDLSISVNTENLHGSVMDQNTAKEEIYPEKTVKRSRKKSVDRERRSSIVGKVADKLFRRRRKSGSETRDKNEIGPGSPDGRDIKSPVRQLSEGDAIRLGYEASQSHRSKHNRSISHDNSGRSEARFRRSHSDGIHSGDKTQQESPEHPTLQTSQSFMHEKRRVSPDRSGNPETNRTHKSGLRKSHSERRVKEKLHPATPEKNPYISGNNRFPKLRDVAVSCNLEENARSDYETSGGLTSPTRLKTSSSGNSNGVVPKRSKSLRLPRERRVREFDSPDTRGYCTAERRDTPLEYRRKCETANGMTYGSLQRSMDENKMQRSVSSNSTGKEYSYLHACHFAPSVRVGSVIADHLEELERRRHYQPQRNMSSDLSMTSSDVSPPQDLPTEITVQSEEDVTSRDVEDQESSRLDDSNDSTNQGLDAETQAALEVAKKLAKLDVKMTRQEWKDYFSDKILPPQVEEALKLAEGEDESSRHDSPTYFENTSGSVETVIDVHQRDAGKISLQSKSRRSQASRRSSSSSEKLGSSRKNSDITVSHNQSPKREEEYASLRASEPIKERLNDSNNNNDSYNRRMNPDPVMYKCPDMNSDEDFEAPVFYTCEMGHRHLPYCEQHKKYASNDNASLTEDSGFHSARERTSMSSWDTRHHPRGTYV